MRISRKIVRVGLGAFALMTGCVSSTTAPNVTQRATHVVQQPAIEPGSEGTSFVSSTSDGGSTSAGAPTPATGALFSGYMVVSGRHGGSNDAGSPRGER